LYEILGAKPTDSFIHLRKRYFSLVEHHKTKTLKAVTSVEFRDIAAAWRILSNPEAKLVYDQAFRVVTQQQQQQQQQQLRPQQQQLRPPQEYEYPDSQDYQGYPPKEMYQRQSQYQQQWQSPLPPPPFQIDEYQQQQLQKQQQRHELDTIRQQRIKMQQMELQLQQQQVQMMQQQQQMKQQQQQQQQQQPPQKMQRPTAPATATTKASPLSGVPRTATTNTTTAIITTSAAKIMTRMTSTELMESSEYYPEQPSGEVMTMPSVTKKSSSPSSPWSANNHLVNLLDLEFRRRQNEESLASKQNNNNNNNATNQTLLLQMDGVAQEGNVTLANSTSTEAVVAAPFFTTSVAQGTMLLGRLLTSHELKTSVQYMIQK
jgi:curved DNA-binding protein CbpA